MAMFDRLYDEHDREWQTKAFGRTLHAYRVGDPILANIPAACQVEVLGDECGEFVDSLATILDGALASIGDARDDRLPLLGYRGAMTHG